MEHQRVDQRAAGVSGRGMHDQADRLVDGDNRHLVQDGLTGDDAHEIFARYTLARSGGTGPPDPEKDDFHIG